MLLKNISDGMEKGRLKTKRWRIIPDSRTNRKQNMTSEKPALPAYLDNIRIILTRTSHPANIGSAARAMKTMGLHKLTIVAPNLMATPMTENPPIFDPEHPQSFKLPEESFILASGAADVLENATIAASLDEALADTTIACLRIVIVC